MKSDGLVAPIKAYWDGRAQDVAADVDLVTHRDRHQRWWEIELILQDLPKGKRILDVGCGNGYSTGIFAGHASYILGVDYSQDMIDRARREHGQTGNAEFEVQDVLNLSLPDKSFDAAICQRCLINLTSWEAQRRAIANIARVLKPGGLFFFQEGTRQGREELNRVRKEIGLSVMPPVSYNLDFDEEQLWPFAKPLFEIVKIRRSGLYDLISRVVHPLVVSPAEPQYDARINQVAAEVSAKFDGCDALGREFSAILKRLPENSGTD
jgi:ubiquinone/menaquinone biosynthesis C-methylase UbiE